MKKTFNFGTALAILREGGAVYRKGWKTKKEWLLLADGDTSNCAADYQLHLDAVENMKLLPWLGLKTRDDMIVPWSPTYADLLGTDWMEAR